MIQVVLDNPYTIVTVPQKTATTSTITVRSMIDDPINKKVTINTEEFGSLIIWEGIEYDNAGQWTDQDVIDRINELYNS